MTWWMRAIAVAMVTTGIVVVAACGKRGPAAASAAHATSETERASRTSSPPETTSSGDAGPDASGEGAKAPRVPPDTSAWPLPAGWRAETIPFPLDFAPELTYQGEEQIRFMPRFFDPAAPTYFSYDFAWILDAKAPPLDSAALAAGLTTYFRGLCDAVGGKKYAFDPARFKGPLRIRGAPCHRDPRISAPARRCRVDRARARRGCLLLSVVLVGAAINAPRAGRSGTRRPRPSRSSRAG
jgi:hypothetical protein